MKGSMLLFWGSKLREVRSGGLKFCICMFWADEGKLQGLILRGREEQEWWICEDIAIVRGRPHG